MIQETTNTIQFAIEDNLSQIVIGIALLIAFILGMLTDSYHQQNVEKKAKDVTRHKTR